LQAGPGIVGDQGDQKRKSKYPGACINKPDQDYMHHGIVTAIYFPVDGHVAK
jgi:hypothetical protein